MELKPILHKVISVNFGAIPAEKESTNLDLKYKIILFAEKKTDFGILFHLEIKEESFSTEIEYFTLFETSEDITEEFTKSSFATLSAPAIAFPFLRAFVSLLVLNAGYSPYILPSINFTKYNPEDIEIETVKIDDSI